MDRSSNCSLAWEPGVSGEWEGTMARVVIVLH
uniref:Uncharacterized protein n=1 Tax=Vitis vinifera TaxID=29760 RepID=F6H6X1_VITVI